MSSFRLGVGGGGELRRGVFGGMKGRERWCEVLDFEWVTPHFRTMLQSQPHRLHLIQKPRGAIRGKARRHIYRLGLHTRNYGQSWFPGRIPLKNQFFQISRLIIRKNFPSRLAGACELPLVQPRAPQTFGFR